MKRSKLLVTAISWIVFSTAVQAAPMPVRHIQHPMHQLMVVRSEAGNIIANGEFSQTVQGDEVTIHLVYRFLDGSLDDETTIYRQQATFQLLRDHHVQQGPFFTKPIDFEVDATSNSTTAWTTDKDGTTEVASHHLDLPSDVANGLIGTLMLNAPRNTAPFRVEMVTPFNGGRLVRLLISRDGERPFQQAGQNLKATVYRVHPELGGIIGMIAKMLGLKPKDVMVWVSQGDDPAVVRTIGQLGGYGPVLSSDVEGTSVTK
jgi:hypothetical protein